MNNPNGSRLWEPAEKEKLRDLYYEGYSDEHIAEELGRSRRAVVGMRSLMKLKNKQRKPIFVIHDAMADYLPKWYVDKLKREWEQKYNGASIK